MSSLSLFCKGSRVPRIHHASAQMSSSVAECSLHCCRHHCLISRRYLAGRLPVLVYEFATGACLEARRFLHHRSFSGGNGDSVEAFLSNAIVGQTVTYAVTADLGEQGQDLTYPMLLQPSEDLIGALAWGGNRIEHSLDPVFLDNQGQALDEPHPAGLECGKFQSVCKSEIRIA